MNFYLIEFTHFTLVFKNPDANYTYLADTSKSRHWKKKTLIGSQCLKETQQSYS